MAVLFAVTVFSLLLPLALLIWWKKRSGAKLSAFLVGSFCFVLFALVLESALHSVVLSGGNALSYAVQSNPVLFVLYTAFAAGFFEETGRFFGFRCLLRKQKSRETAVAYGIGHGGIEVFLLLFVNYLMYLLAYLGVQFGDAETTAGLAAIAGSIDLPGGLTAMLERLSAVMGHLGLSMLVFTAVWQKGKRFRYPLAILLHALLDVPAALFQLGVLSSVPAVEGLLAALGALLLLIGLRALQGYAEPQESIANPAQT